MPLGISFGILYLLLDFVSISGGGGWGESKTNPEMKLLGFGMSPGVDEKICGICFIEDIRRSLCLKYRIYNEYLRERNFSLEREFLKRYCQMFEKEDEDFSQ